MKPYEGDQKRFPSNATVSDDDHAWIASGRHWTLTPENGIPNPAQYVPPKGSSISKKNPSEITVRVNGNEAPPIKWEHFSAKDQEWVGQAELNWFHPAE